MPAKRKKYDLPAVERIELTERRIPLRAALAALGVAAMLVVLGVALTRLLSVETGWWTIESDGSRGVHCGGDFEFVADVKTAAEVKQLTLAYTEATAKAYALFSTAFIDGVEPNLGYINAHPGEDVRVDPALYKALKTAAEARYIYLAPIYDVHQSLCACENDVETISFDPMRDGDARAFCAEAAAFARDPGAVNLSFPSENVVRLDLSDEYAAFLKDNACQAVDFGWMKNAFIADLLADAILETGFTRGAISSRDGFTRCLDDSGTIYELPLYELKNGAVVQTGALRYEGPAAVASFHAFPADAIDARNYYLFNNGEIRAPYIALSDGLTHTALPALTAASRTKTCGALTIAAAPLYIAETDTPVNINDIVLITPEADHWISTDKRFDVS